MKKKKIVSLLLAVTMVFAMIPAFFVSASATEGWTQVDLSDKNDGDSVTVDGVDYVVIKTTTGVITKELNGNYILGADLDFNGEASALVSISSINFKGGIFNGNGYSMSGYQVVDNYNGTFKRNDNGFSNLKICNLTLGRKGDPIASAQKQQGGALFGFVSDTDAEFTIENVTIYATVTQTGSNNKRIGGFIGSINVKSLTIENCAFEGEVYSASASVKAAGFVAFIEGKTTVSLKNCTTRGTINGQGYSGGFIGSFLSGTNVVTLDNCVNYANVTAANAAGGMVGAQLEAAITLTKCLNAGTVSSTTAAGGLIGSTTPTAETNTTDISSCAYLNATNPIGNNPEAVENVLTITDCQSVTVENFEESKTWLTTNFPNLLFVKNSDAVAVVLPAEAKFLQCRENGQNLDFRLIGAFNGAVSDYANVGFKVILKEGSGDSATQLLEPFDLEEQTLYTSIIANTDLGAKTYTAEELGAAYLYTIVIPNISTVGTYTLELFAFATKKGENAQPEYDDLATIVIVDGVIQ